LAWANTELADDHQTKFVTPLAQPVNFSWGPAVDDLPVLLEAAFNHSPPSITMPYLADELRGQIYFTVIHRIKLLKSFFHDSTTEKTKHYRGKS
jgi:hypothetical protein